MARDVILETEGLTKEFRGFVAVKNVNLAVRRGTHPRADRPQRRRQDHLLQPPHPLPDPDPRAHPLQRARHHRLAALRRSPASVWCARSRSRPCSRTSSVLENVRIALQRRRGPLVRLLALGAGARRAERPGPASCSTRSGLADFVGDARGRAALRAQARPGDRHHPRPRPRDDAARRAHRGHGPRGRGADLRPHQDGGRQPHRPDGRAQPERGREPLRHHHRARRAARCSPRADYASVSGTPRSIQAYMGSDAGLRARGWLPNRTPPARSAGRARPARLVRRVAHPARRRPRRAPRARW